MVVTDGLEIVEIATVVFKGNLFGKSSLSNIIFLLVWNGKHPKMIQCICENWESSTVTVLNKADQWENLEL